MNPSDRTGPKNESATSRFPPWIRTTRIRPACMTCQIMRARQKSGALRPFLFWFARQRTGVTTRRQAAALNKLRDEGHEDATTREIKKKEAFQTLCETRGPHGTWTKREGTLGTQKKTSRQAELQPRRHEKETRERSETDPWRVTLLVVARWTQSVTHIIRALFCPSESSVGNKRLSDPTV